MKLFVYIKDLVLYIISESQRIMLSTVHEKEQYFYHYSLPLVTITSIMKWVVETVIDGVSVKDIQLVPQNELNAGTIYTGRPVGNSPEFIPQDNILNAEVKWLHYYHCVVTNKFDDKDTRKLSMETPKLIARGIIFLLENE